MLKKLFRLHTAVISIFLVILSVIPSTITNAKTVHHAVKNTTLPLFLPKATNEFGVSYTYRTYLTPFSAPIPNFGNPLEFDFSTVHNNSTSVDTHYSNRFIFSGDFYENSTGFFEDQTYTELNQAGFYDFKKRVALLIKFPVKKGESWINYGFPINYVDTFGNAMPWLYGICHSVILSISTSVSTPYKTFNNAIEVETKSGVIILYNYYVPGVGLVESKQYSNKQMVYLFELLSINK